MPKDGELRSNKVKSKKFTQTATNVTNTKGLLYKDGLFIGFMLENVGTSGSSKSDDFPNANEGVLYYAAERVILPKEAGGGFGFSIGDVAYFDDNGGSQKLTTTTTSNTKCAVVLVAVATDATQVEVDLQGDGRTLN